MIYQITSDNMEVSESMKELAMSKISKIDNRFPDMPEDAKTARIVMNTAPVEKFEVKVELDLNGEKFFTDEIEFSLETALVAVVEELDRKIEKSKLGTKNWEEQREAKRFPTEGVEVTDEELSSE